MNVSAWSIRNPIPAVMVFVLLTVAGLFSFSAMKVQNFPDIDLPTITVSASLPGASPSQLENDVARKIENSIATIQGLKHITTKVQDGAATLIVEFRLEKPLQEALDETRSAVQRVRADLPADLRDPVVNKLDLAAQPVLAYTIASPRMDDEALSWFVDNDIQRMLLALPGVGAVNRVGGVVPARSWIHRSTCSPMRRFIATTRRCPSGENCGFWNSAACDNSRSDPSGCASTSSYIREAGTYASVPPGETATCGSPEVSSLLTPSTTGTKGPLTSTCVGSNGAASNVAPRLTTSCPPAY